MTLAASFLGGAKSRLLPASIPFRFFGAAAIFQLLMWLALLTSSYDATNFRGGLGPVLATVHFLTLGVLTSTAIGASAQLLPVATRRPLAAHWPIKLVFWLFIPGLIALCAGMYTAIPIIVTSAAVVTAVGLVIFAGILADNLRRATSLPVVAAYGWGALLSLLLLAGIGLTLAGDYQFGILPDHDAVALTHVILGGFGFMGLLVLGFSHILVPMFSLAATPATRPAFIGFALAGAAVALGSVGAVASSSLTLTFAASIGLAAAGLHLWLMHRALATGMRKRLGLSFALIRTAWVMLPTTLLVGLAALYGYAGSNGPTLFGFLLIGGWLLTFLLGTLQRILPFLASMHAARTPGKSPPPISELAASGPIKIHAMCHVMALIAVALAIVADTPALLRVGAAIGLVGASAFIWFAAGVMRWLVQQA